MATTSGKNRYPPRLYEEGKAPKQLKSMNHYCFMSNLQMVKEAIGNDAWDAVKNSSVGIIARFKELDYTWSALTVHYLLTNQLAIEKRYEVWSLIDDQPIRFSLHEFKAITGLNCDSFEINDHLDVDHREFWDELKVSSIEGPSLNDLQLVLGRCKDWEFEKRRMVGWLAILSVGILGISPASKMPLKLAKKVLDPEAFESYPWGRIACSSLIESIKVASFGVKKSYILHGCVHALLIWAYESIHVFGRLFGNKRDGAELPLLAYAGSRPRVDFSEIIRVEKQANDNKVPVLHFTQNHGEDIEPKWDSDNKDVKVSNMIEDILNGCLDTSAWSVNKGQTEKKKKRKVKVECDVQGECEVQVECEVHADSDVHEKTTIKKKDVGNSYGGIDKNLITMVTALTEKVDNLDRNLANKVSISLEPIIDGRVSAVVNEKLASANEKIAKLEEDVKYLKDRLQAGATKEATNSKDNMNDDATSNAMSWCVHTKAASHDGFPVSCVIKTEKKQIEKKTKETKHSPETVLPSKKTVKVEGFAKEAATSGDTWSDPILREKVKMVGCNIDALSKVFPKRVPNLSQSQRLPFIGNSTVKRIITGITPSVAAYDPFAQVEESKFMKLKEAISHQEHLPAWESNGEFYKRIFTPREQWPTETYGWLTNSHMCDAIVMLHKRSLCDPSPYHSSRIAFLNQWFVDSWVRDYKEYNPKTWVIPERYKGVFNGTYPADLVSNKKWLVDVDHVYCCHFINDNHWVALDIDLVKEKIHVYDSILTLVKDEKTILEVCRPFTRMIPAMLNAMLPSDIRKKSEKQFTVKRLKNIPQNDNPGDCGVFTIKYIECLAIGCTFEGLSDERIQDIRCKLAVDLFECDEYRDDIMPDHVIRRGDLTEHLMLRDSD